MSRWHSPFTRTISLFTASALLATATIGGAEQLEPDEEDRPAGYPFIRGIQETGLLRSDPQRTSPGVTLLPTEGDRTVHLVDEAGREIHRWAVDAERARLLKNGRLIALHGTDWGRASDPAVDALRPVVREYAPNGAITWEYKAESTLHHDVTLTPSGTLLLRHVQAPLPAEFVPRLQQYKSFRRLHGSIRTDEVLEVARDGTVLWRWSYADHFSFGTCGNKPCGKKSSARPFGLDWTHTNTAITIPENRWYREGHTAFTPGNVLLLPRNWSTVLIISRATGKEVWRYDGAGVGGLGRPHEAHIIPEGLPGAGNLLLFDNGVGAHDGRSVILEVHPLTGTKVWSYQAGAAFFSRTRGSVQRLPNGNTLISEDRQGRCFEVTTEGEIVWLYQMPTIINRCSRYPTTWAP